jgi:hypothetical protein
LLDLLSRIVEGKNPPDAKAFMAAGWAARDESFRLWSAAAGIWVEGGVARQTVERNPVGGDELIRHDTLTEKREVWMSVDQLTPPQLGKPIGAHHSKPRRELKDAIAMLRAIAAVADEDAWCALIFIGGGSHATYLGRITARAIATNNTGP